MKIEKGHTVGAMSVVDDDPERPADELARLNELADELNREAEDVLEYQVIP